MFLQMPVPISMTDWCISGLTRSFRSSLPSSRISWTWERSSRVSGSMIWNSSSTPSVKAGRSIMPSGVLSLEWARRAAPGPAGRAAAAGARAGRGPAAPRPSVGSRGPETGLPAESGARRLGRPASTRSISHFEACSSTHSKFSWPTDRPGPRPARGSGSRSRRESRRAPRTRACRSRSRARSRASGSRRGPRVQRGLDRRRVLDVPVARCGCRGS